MGEGVPSPHTHYTPIQYLTNLESQLAALGEPPVRQVALEEGFACVLLQDGDLRCWYGSDELEVPEGSMREIYVTRDVACGYTSSRIDPHLVCWGRGGGGGATPISGIFSGLSVPFGGGTFPTYGVCAFETNGGALRCFDTSGGSDKTPGSRWPAAVAALSHSCAVEVGGEYDGRIVQFGCSETTCGDAYPIFALSSHYSGVAAALTTGGGQNVCGIRSADGGVECSRELVTPAYGAFTQVEIEHYRVTVNNAPLEVCGLTVEGWVRCFGDSSIYDDLWTPW
jgi:hypothetical protein